MAAGKKRGRVSAAKSIPSDSTRGPRPRKQRRCGRKACMTERGAVEEAARLSAKGSSARPYYCGACSCWHVGNWKASP